MNFAAAAAAAAVSGWLRELTVRLSHLSQLLTAAAAAAAPAAAVSGRLRELTMRLSHLLQLDPRKASLMGSSLEDEVFKYGEMGMLLHVASGVRVLFRCTCCVAGLGSDHHAVLWYSTVWGDGHGAACGCRCEGLGLGVAQVYMLSGGLRCKCTMPCCKFCWVNLLRCSLLFIKEATGLPAGLLA
jgi:hypothetical protein